MGKPPPPPLNGRLPARVFITTAAFHDACCCWALVLTTAVHRRVHCTCERLTLAVGSHFGSRCWLMSEHLAFLGKASITEP